MPIRPEDFDLSPPRRDTTVISDPGLEKRSRPKKEQRTSSENGGNAPARKTIPLLIAAALFATVLLMSRKPLAKFVTGLVNKLSTTDIGDQQSRREFERKQAELERDRKRLADEQIALEMEKREQAKAAERASEQAKQDELNRRQLADAQIALEAQRQRQEKAAALARQEELNRQKQLAEVQAELERQKRAEREAATRASAQAKQDELNRIQKQRELEGKERERASRAQYDGPSSGTLIWEGEVNGADLIEIQDGNPNHGVLQGSFPGLPVMVQAFPADSVTISVAPAPSNEWNRIVLQVRANGLKKRKVTVRWALVK
jgi:hypothetical protein